MSKLQQQNNSYFFPQEAVKQQAAAFLPDDVAALLANWCAGVACDRLSPLHQRVQVLWMRLRGGLVQTDHIGGGGSKLWEALRRKRRGQNIMALCFKHFCVTLKPLCQSQEFGIERRTQPFNLAPSLSGW